MERPRRVVPTLFLGVPGRDSRVVNLIPITIVTPWIAWSFSSRPSPPNPPVSPDDGIVIVNLSAHRDKDVELASKFLLDLPLNHEDSTAKTLDKINQISGWEKTIAGAIVLLAMGMVLLFVAGEGLIHWNKKAPSSPPETLQVPPEPMEPAALRVLEAFFEAPDLTGKAALVRDSERVRPMMKDFHQRRGHPFPTLDRVSKGQASNIDGTQLVFFQVKPFSGPDFPVAVVWDGHHFTVDWVSMTAYGTIDWSEFVATRPLAPNTMRVYAQTAYEAEQIPDAPHGCVTFRIEHRDDPNGLLVLADEHIAAALMPIVVHRKVPVTLELRWRPEGPGGALVPAITRFIAPKWSP